MKLTKIVKIGGHKYMVKHYMPEPAITLLFDVMDIITPVLDSLDAEVVANMVARIGAEEDPVTDTAVDEATSLFSADEPTAIDATASTFGDASDIEMLRMLSPLIKKLSRTDMNKLLHRICDKVIYSGVDDTHDFGDGESDDYSEKGPLATHWNTHFMGKPFLVFKIAWEMLAFNYTSFLDGNPVTAALLEKTQKAQK